MMWNNQFYTLVSIVTIFNTVVLPFSPATLRPQASTYPRVIHSDLTQVISAQHNYFSPPNFSIIPSSGHVSLKSVHRNNFSALSAITMIEPSIMESTTTLLSTTMQSVLSNENIKQAFSLATFGPQYLWILMIVFPNTKITKKIMGGYWGILAFSFVHLFIVIASATQENGTAPIAEFNGVFDPSPDADPQAAMIGMMRYPNFVSEEWSHVLTWDLFVGRIIWLDGLKRGIFTPHSILFCNLIGPPGFLLHCATCLLTGKGIIGNEAEALDDD